MLYLWPGVLVLPLQLVRASASAGQWSIKTWCFKCWPTYSVCVNCQSLTSTSYLHSKKSNCIQALRYLFCRSTAVF